MFLPELPWLLASPIETGGSTWCISFCDNAQIADCRIPDVGSPLPVCANICGSVGWALLGSTCVVCASQHDGEGESAVLALTLLVEQEWML